MKLIESHQMWMVAAIAGFVSFDIGYMFNSFLFIIITAPILFVLFLLIIAIYNWAKDER